jgi:hypothetical protein
MGKKSIARVYRIVVRSELGGRYASAFEGMRMETRNGRTILTGEKSRTSRACLASSAALTAWGWSY